MHYAGYLFLFYFIFPINLLHYFIFFLLHHLRHDLPKLYIFSPCPPLLASACLITLASRLNLFSYIFRPTTSVFINFPAFQLFCTFYISILPVSFPFPSSFSHLLPRSLYPMFPFLLVLIFRLSICPLPQHTCPVSYLSLAAES